jgi:hypothetical protein
MLNAGSEKPVGLDAGGVAWAGVMDTGRGGGQSLRPFDYFNVIAIRDRQKAPVTAKQARSGQAAPTSALASRTAELASGL